MNIMTFSSERTKCNGKVGMKCWESEVGGIATIKVKSEWVTKWAFNWRGKRPCTDNSELSVHIYVTRKGFSKRE